MAKWQIDRELDVGPESGRDTERAVAVHLKRPVGTGDHQITVEYVHGAPPSATPWSAVHPYLDTEKPPRRLLVARDGQVSVVEA